MFQQTASHNNNKKNKNNFLKNNQRAATPRTEPAGSGLDGILEMTCPESNKINHTCSSDLWDTTSLVTSEEIPKQEYETASTI